MITKLLVPLLVLGSVAGEGGPDSSNLRGRDLASLKKVCIYLGRDFGFQTFEVPFGKIVFSVQIYCQTSYDMSIIDQVLLPYDLLQTSTDFTLHLLGSFLLNTESVTQIR